MDNMETIPVVEESQATQVLSPIRPMESLTPSPSLLERAKSTLVLGETVEVSGNTGEVANDQDEHYEEAEEEQNEQDPIVEVPQQHGDEIIEIETDGETEEQNINGVEVEEEKQKPLEQISERLEDSQVPASHVPACPDVESPAVGGKENTGGSFIETQLDSETEENDKSKGAFKVWFFSGWIWMLCFFLVGVMYIHVKKRRMINIFVDLASTNIPGYISI